VKPYGVGPNDSTLQIFQEILFILGILNDREGFNKQNICFSSS